jgi:guanosine-3',5'-bis(diphosphate) 3'-pyrophosphohydrolase
MKHKKYTIEDVKNFAESCHLGQMYGEESYVTHLDDVYNIAKGYTDDKEILAACYLHDVLEDTNCSYKTLVKNFGKNVAEIVYAVTDELGRDRKERKEKTYPKIAKNDKAITLKACDRLANVMASYKGGLWMWEKYNVKKYNMYAGEHKVFCEQLNLSNKSKLTVHCDLFKELDFHFS